MNAASPDHRMRSGFLRFSLWTSALAFFVIEGYVLQDQWQIGHASTMFMLGTAFVIAGVCIGLFAIIVAVGVGISAALSDEAPHDHRAPRHATPDR